MELADFETQEEWEKFLLAKHEEYKQVKSKFREKKGHSSPFYKWDKQDAIAKLLKKEDEIISRYRNFYLVD